MSGISSFPLKKRNAKASMLPDKFTDADLKAVYNDRENGRGRGVAGIREGWEEESLALQEEAARSTPDARLDAVEDRLAALTASVQRLEVTLRSVERSVGFHVANARTSVTKEPRLRAA